MKGAEYALSAQFVPAMSCAPDAMTTVSAAAHIMRERHVENLIVVDGVDNARVPVVIVTASGYRGSRNVKRSCPHVNSKGGYSVICKHEPHPGTRWRLQRRAAVTLMNLTDPLKSTVSPASFARMLDHIHSFPAIVNRYGS